MKKFILSLILSAAFFGCDKESGQDTGNETGDDGEVITSLAGTIWKAQGERTDYELTFTATHCTFTIIGESGIPYSETNTYTYDPPAVVIASPIGVPGTGTVKNDSMKVVIWLTNDVCWDPELKKQ